MEPMYYIQLDVHNRKISYCVKDNSGKVFAEGLLSATRLDLDLWMKTLPHRHSDRSTPHPNSDTTRTVIPTGAGRLFSSAFASCERVGLRSGGISLRLRTCPEHLEYSRRTVISTRAPRNTRPCPHGHSDRSRPTLFFRVRFLRTRRSA
jgi:hypothetical protein